MIVVEQFLLCPVDICMCCIVVNKLFKFKIKVFRDYDYFYISKNMIYTYLINLTSN